MQRIWKMLLMIVTIVLLDQFSKGIIQNQMNYGQSIPVLEGLFSITYVKNTGAAFGIGAEANHWVRGIFFLLLPLVACFWLCVLIYKSRNSSLRLSLAYSLILAGAIGNLIDRFYYGYVVDFLDFFWQESHFPAFNVADSSITIAAFILILDFFIESRKNFKLEKT